MNVQTSASLQSLPDELLQPIFQALCRHCCRISNYLDRNPCAKSLRSLALTSKRFHSIALPILLHVPEDHISGERLHKILDRDPSLGKNIKQWELPAWEDKEEYLGPMRETTRRLLRTTIGEEIDFEQAEKEGLSVENSLETELFMVRAPFVEKLTLERYDWNEWPDTDFKYLARRLGRLGDGTGFENVRYLSVTRPCDATTSIADPHLITLLGAMPNLRHLRLDMILGLDRHDAIDFGRIKPALGSLTTLKFVSCTFNHGGAASGYGVLCEMLKNTPNLASFQFSAYSSSGAPSFIDHEVTMQDFLEALQPVSSHLKHLELDLTQSFSGGEEYNSSLLASFTALETFFVGLWDICQCDRVPFVPCTQDIIPRTVKHLRLILDRGSRTPCPRCMTGISRKAAEGGLKTLERIDIQPSSWGMNFQAPYTPEPFIDEEVEGWKKLHHEFLATHISLRFRGTFYSRVQRGKGDDLGGIEIVAKEVHEDDD